MSKTVIKAAFIFLLGLAGHKTKPICDSFAKGFDKISAYGVGVALLALGMLIILPREKHEEFILAYSLDAVLIGFGVTFGYVQDKLEKEKTNKLIIEV